MEAYSTQQLLVLRKLTRSISDLLRSQLKNYLSTLTPALRPSAVLGNYIHSSSKETIGGADKAFKDLQALYETVASSSPFSLPKELNPPIEILSTTLEIVPMEYVHVAKAEQRNKTITVTSPLKWVLTYSGFRRERLKDLLTGATGSSNELREFLLHYLVMHLVVSKQTGAAQILDALHFPIGSERSPEFGSLPVTTISCSVSTILPPDEVIIESTEISGMDAFEELVKIDDIVNMRDPLKDRLIQLVKSHGEDLLIMAERH